MDCDFLEEKMFDCQNRIAMTQYDESKLSDNGIFKDHPHNQEQAYWYFMGVYEGYNEVYLKINQSITK